MPELLAPEAQRLPQRCSEHKVWKPASVKRLAATANQRPHAASTNIQADGCKKGPGKLDWSFSILNFQSGPRRPHIRSNIPLLRVGMPKASMVASALDASKPPTLTR